MSVLYEKLFELCKKRSISAYRMCKDTGIQPSIMTDLKMGRRHTVKAETAAKLAAYFGVSVDYLLGNEEKEKPAIDEGDGLEDLLKDQFIAFYGEVKDSLDETDIEDLKTFMRMKAEIKKNREKK